MNVNLSISLFSSISFCFLYFENLLSWIYVYDSYVFLTKWLFMILKFCHSIFFWNSLFLIRCNSNHCSLCNFFFPFWLLLTFFFFKPSLAQHCDSSVICVVFLCVYLLLELLYFFSLIKKKILGQHVLRYFFWPIFYSSQFTWKLIRLFNIAQQIMDSFHFFHLFLSLWVHFWGINLS